MHIMLPDLSVWAQGPPPEKLERLQDIFANLVTYITTIAGFALFIMLIIGGFRFLTSGGEPKAVAQARNTLTFAILGLVLVIASILILKLIEELTGVTVTIFRIKLPT